VRSLSAGLTWSVAAAWLTSLTTALWFNAFKCCLRRAAGRNRRRLPAPPAGAGLSVLDLPFPILLLDEASAADAARRAAENIGKVGGTGGWRGRLLGSGMAWRWRSPARCLQDRCRCGKGWAKGAPGRISCLRLFPTGTVLRGPTPNPGAGCRCGRCRPAPPAPRAPWQHVVG
jgi:hypothetical protein